jgi:hypothetical protein
MEAVKSVNPAAASTATEGFFGWELKGCPGRFPHATKCDGFAFRSPNGDQRAWSRPPRQDWWKWCGTVQAITLVLARV